MTPATAERRERAGAWLSELHGRAREWVAAQRTPNDLARTGEYVDLMFAFGQARLGQRLVAQELLSRASGALAAADEAHQALLEAFRYRVEQALSGEPLRGPLPLAWYESLANGDRLLGFVVDRARKHFRILEADRRINPYRHWGARISEFERGLATLEEHMDSATFVARVEELRSGCKKGKRGQAERDRLFRTALEHASLATGPAVRGWLGETAHRLSGEPLPREQGELLDFLAFATSSVQAAAHHRLRDELLQAVRVLPRLVADNAQSARGLALDKLLSACVRGLIALNLPDELDSFLGEVTPKLPAITEGNQFKLLCLQARVAEGWYAFGWASLAKPVVERAIDVLPSMSWREVGTLACAVASAVRGAGAEEARSVYRRILERARGQDHLTTRTHYDLLQLEIAEAIVRSAAEAFLND